MESVNIEEEMEVERVNATAVESAVATTQQPVVVGKKSRTRPARSKRDVAQT